MIFVLISAVGCHLSTVSAARIDSVRYVKTSGSYQGDGLSWATAKNSLQDAINELRQYLETNTDGIKSGSIYVAAGTYKPTESTESEGGGLQYTAFKLYPGIHIYGGFAEDITDMAAKPYNADGSINTTYRPLVDTLPSLESGQAAKTHPWNFVHKTILTGSHIGETSFIFNPTHGYFNTNFPGNSYHVVWFATSGFIDAGGNRNNSDHALPLSRSACVDGFVITGGYASNNSTFDRYHTAYGGGVYLVAGGEVRNCEIYYCEATMRGGGVYLDGGGIVDKCFIHSCQAKGVGIMQGYGGGVCIDYDGAVTRSYIVNNASRLGGGAAICHAPDEYPWENLDDWRVANGGTRRGEINVYSPHATACIISNNTSTAEAGGIYFYDGGVGNHLTIVRNKCIGQDVIYSGRRHGRSGGIYILNGGQIYNSVVWGNRCAANNNIQYATYIGGSTEDTKDGAGNVIKEGLKPKFYYSAIENHDITDWAGSLKNQVMSLENTNINESANNANYPYFIGSDGHGRMMGYAGAGLNLSLPMGKLDEDFANGLITEPRADSTGIPRPIYWKPAAISSMAKMGLQVTEAIHVSSQWVLHAHTGTDLFGDEYEPMSTFGALVCREEQFGCVMVSNQEKSLYRDRGYTQNGAITDYNTTVGDNTFLPVQLPDDGTIDELPTLFVDPVRNAGEAGIIIGEQGIGGTWDKPVGSINDAIHYFRLHMKKDGSGHIVYDANGDVEYEIDINNNGVIDESEHFKYVQILVKGYERGGAINATTAGKDAYLGAQLRTAALRPCSNMRIYGGYYYGSTGTATDQHNARMYPTVVSANITKSGYENNSAHVLALINVRNVIVDGLRLFDGNANLYEHHSYAPIDSITGQREDITYGGGIILNNVSVPKEERIDMTGNIFRNSYIANCSAPDGAAVYVNSSNRKGDNTYSKAELNIFNTIIRNNTVGDGTGNVTVQGDAGVVTACGGEAKIRLDHCNIVNNCGYGLETLVATDNPSGTDADEGQIRIYNSVLYANGEAAIPNRSKQPQALGYRSTTGSTHNVSGDYIYLDWDAPTPNTPAHLYANLCRDFSDQTHKWGIRLLDINTQMSKIRGDGKADTYFFDTEAEANAHISSHSAPSGYEWSTPVYLQYPYFDNPARNVGHSPDGDKPMNGGIISYMPGNQNPMVNAASENSALIWDSNGNVRTRGGTPDIGAIENTHLPVKGAVLYVTPDGAGRHDGSSWDNAIAGNTVYMLENIAGPGLASGDYIDLVPSCDRVLDSSGNPVLTTDTKYCGGFGRSYFTSAKTGVATATTIRHMWTTEINEYIGGSRNGETETLQNNVYSYDSTTVVTNPGTNVGGFDSGWMYDERYPYGEISGASRSFWRANPYHTGTDWNNASSPSYNLAGFIDACNTNGWINNTRAERYVGGLQYAVEKAAAYNALSDSDPGRISGVDSVVVWVGNGRYNDYKGFVMRDKTTVLGGFPAQSIGTPGTTERQALMSDIINIPKSLKAKDYDPKDYETILQISDVNPRLGDTILNYSLNPAAKFFSDDDLSLSSITDTRSYQYKNINIVNSYNYETIPSTTVNTEVTTDYIRYPEMTINGNGIELEANTHLIDDGTTSGTVHYEFGVAGNGLDCWHMTHPNKTNYVADRVTDNNSQNKQRSIYDPSTNIMLTGANASYNGDWIFIGNGSLTGLTLWQDLPNVPAGDYQLTVDIAGGYRNAWKSTEDTKMYLRIYDANGIKKAEVNIKTRGSYANSDNGDNNRNMAYRHVIQFNQPSTGTVKVAVEVEDGVRNTKARNATYGTDDGGDPDEIPSEYTTGYGGSNPNRREFWISNLHMHEVEVIPGHSGYVLSTNTTESDNNDVPHKPTETISTSGYSVSNQRGPLRKRVLTMPDICVPTYGAGSVGNPAAAGSGTDARGKFSDDLSHTHRVTGPTKAKRTSWEKASFVGEDPNYVEYSNVYWDGFTIRHGFIVDEGMAHGGGAGVNLYEGAHLQNCIVVNNLTICPRVKGGGIFCDGATSTIEGCFALDNTSTHSSLYEQNQIFAGGMFMYEGTCFNSLFANNSSFGSAGGVGFCVGRFYNNTIAYNTCTLKESNKYSGGAISLATSSAPNLFVANTIIYGNNGIAIRDRDAGVNKVSPFLHCYIQSEVAQPNNTTKQNVNNWTSSATSNYGIGNIFLNGITPSIRNTPFEADVLYGINSDKGAKATNNYRLSSSLSSDSTCINKGTELFGATLAEAFEHKHGSNWATDVQRKAFYDVVVAAVPPDNDVAYADRVQDCQIDIGAYEYDGTMDIHPGYELIAFDPEQPDVRELCAIYYVAETGEGLGTAASPEDAACPEKIQKVLDAAGRLKADLALIQSGRASDRIFSTTSVEVTGNVTATYEEIYLDGATKKVRQQSVSKNLSEVRHVIVKLTEGTYAPVRSTNEKMVSGVAEDLLTTHSIAVPRGVEIWGGYTNDGDYDFYETYRDPLNNKTNLNGNVYNVTTEESGRTYHVLTFTNNIYGINNLLAPDVIIAGNTYKSEGMLDTLSAWGVLTDRAIVDGMCVDSGMANGVDEIDRRGAAAIVPDYAHIRNCVIQNNEAVREAGGLYLQPAALVSGCVLVGNRSEFGGAIYIEEPAIANDATYVRIFNSTIVGNKANTRGGGIWYENNLRAKGVVLWRNSSNDMNNVSGVFDTGKPMTEDNYPFAYSAVQTRRMPGVNNIVLQIEADKDVRWTQNSVDDMRWRGERDTYSSQSNPDGYFYIEKLSALVRAGMPYTDYRTLRATYPSLELRDMAGVARMRERYNNDEADSISATIGYLKHMTFVPEHKNNEFIEIGARALNYDMGLSIDRPFTRLYVANPEFVNNEKAATLLECGDPLYSQQGSSMANPFQKFSDALDYIVRLRSSEIVVPGSGKKLRDIYRDSRFEIMIAGGTYWPNYNARGQEGHARASTFLLPEGVTVTGGLSPDTFYCQQGYNFEFLQPMAGNAILNSGTGVETNERNTIYDKDGNDITATMASSGIELISAVSDRIWTNRPRADINGNNIYEPWEFLYATTFSGETARGEENMDNVYHIFTSYADSTHVGALPRRYSAYHNGDTYNTEHPNERFNPAEELDHFSGGTEDANSELHRMIIFNGVSITNGNARDYESIATNNMHNFYRGGGIFVDGNWFNGDYDSGIDSVTMSGDTVYLPGYSTDPDQRGLRDIPMMIVSSQLQGNNAVQGGAVFSNGSLTVFGSSFVQNYAMGPTDDSGANKDAIQYHGGGAIAVNGTMRCSNSIFANNEALFGATPLSASAKGYNRQGFGGAIWGGQNSNVLTTNCDIVNNKGISYPAVYVDNTEDTRKLSLNTIYWGNRAAGIEDSTSTWIGEFAALRSLSDLNKDVFNFRTAVEKERTLLLVEKEKAGTITSAESDELEEFRSHQIMFFCCYRPTFGPDYELTSDSIELKATDPVVMEFTAKYPALGGSVLGKYDPHELPFLGEDVNYYNIFKANNNVYVTFENEGIDGPNFVLPSTKAGKEGYNPSANWMPARINNLTDAGWSYLTLVDVNGKTEFKKNAYSQNAWDNFPDNRVGGGPYNFYASYLKSLYGLTFMPFGEQFYMQLVGSNAGSNEDNNMLRISSNPLVMNASGEEKTYIDLGVYEYQHRTLRINQSSDVDILWVSETENMEKGNDGYSWETPTSNLQAAIETLMRSRNGHDKQVNIIGGSYKPSALLGSGDDLSMSFTIQSRMMNSGALTPISGESFGIGSLTLRGGYDPKIEGEKGYNTEKNPVVFSMAKRLMSTDEQLGHIVNILDVEQYVTTMTQSGDLVTKDNHATGKVIPLTFEGITFENTLAKNMHKGAAIYYHKQTKYDNDTQDKGDVLLDSVGGQYKLTLRNCIFKNNGEPTSGASAVEVEGGGGRSFIVNTLFHHNDGAPLNSLNTTVLNCTFAHNGGYLTLKETEERGVDYHCSLHNSIIWQDDTIHDGATKWSIKDKTDTEIVMGTSDSITYNAYTLPGDETGLEGTDVDAKQNIQISKTNNDVLLGPNFADPRGGDFHLYASKRVMNTGDDATYARLVWPEYYFASTPPDREVYAALMQNNHVDQSRYDTITSTMFINGKDTTITYYKLVAPKDCDLGGTRRLQSTHIDRGAYECLSNGQRILYVDPNRTASVDEINGRDWQHAFGPNKLQLAIDAASIYSTNTDKQAYVFIKGNTASQGNVTMREGVDVYGSLPGTFRGQAVPIDPEATDLEYTEKEVEAFVNRVKAERGGMAAANNTASKITGVNTVSFLAHTHGALLDGFLITNGATAESPASVPAVNILVPNVTVRNCIVTGNVTSDGHPIVNMSGRSSDPTDQRSLLYNTLVYGNKAGTTTPGTIVYVGDRGYALNNTIIADNAGETPLSGSTYVMTDHFDEHVKNNICVNESSGMGSMFAPYMRTDANAYTPAAYLTRHRPYWYQLVETSDLINAGVDDGTTAKSGGNSVAGAFPNYVNFDLDRDLLGNPRRLGGRVDNGCYETWLVNSALDRYCTSETNDKANIDINKYVYDTSPVTDPSAEGYDADALATYNSLLGEGKILPMADYWTENYGGNHYPHIGSVLYMMENAKLVFDTVGSDPLFESSTAIRPGFVLMKPGSSLYGQTNALQFAYVAAERPFDSATKYGLVSMPFDCNLNATSSKTSTGFAAYTYADSLRAAYNYEFHSTESPIWRDYDKTNQMAATKGWLLEFESALAANDTLRFTGWSATEGGYVYEERARSTEKIVTLHQSDYRPTDGSARFTRQEDMGWNLVGMPYLVSGYRTDIVEAGRYNMHIPHLLYRINTEDGTFPNTAYAAQSWASSSALTLYEGCFMQTAAIANSEDLHFRLPAYSGSPVLMAPRPIIRFMNANGQGDILRVEPDEDAEHVVNYSMGRDGVKWLLSDMPQMYMLATNQTRMSLAGAAPTETDLPLGIHIPDNNLLSAEDYQLFTFSLPEPEAYDDYEHVWLIDRALNHVTDLMQNDYTVTLSPETNHSRFFMRIGGMPLSGPDGREYIVFAYKEQLFVRGLLEGDEIRVFSADGRLILSATAHDTEFTATLPQTEGIYAVTVNGYSKKVTNM